MSIQRYLFLFLLIQSTVSLQAQHLPVNRIDAYHDTHIKKDLGLLDLSINRANKVNQFHAGGLKESSDYIKTWSLAQLDTLGKELYVEVYQDQYPISDKSLVLQLEIAHRYVESKENKKALEAYKKALIYDREKIWHDKIVYWIAQLHVNSKEYNQARKRFLELADDFPTSDYSAKALYARGALYLIEENYDAATEAFELLRKRYPHDDVTRTIGTALGEAYYQQRRFRDVITSLTSELPYLSDESLSKAVYLIAESYNYLQEYDKAVTTYLRYININQGKDEVRFAHYGLGWVYHKQGIYHWAAESFGKSVTNNDQLSRKALYYKAVNEKLAGRYDLSLETFSQFGKSFKKTGFWVEETFYEWAVTTYELGRFTETISVLLDLIRSDVKLEKPGRVFTLLGESYFANQEYTRAIAAFDEAEKSVTIEPEVKLQARFQKAWVLFRNQAYEQSKVVFEEIYNDYPNKPLGAEALFWAADSYYSLEDYGPAGARFERFLENHTGHRLTGAALYSLGWCHFKMRFYQKSITAFETFIHDYEPPPIALYPYETDTQLRLGDAHYALGNYDDAIGWYEKAIGAEPGGDYAMFQIANAHYRADRTYEAVTTFRRVLKIYPFSKIREQAQYNIAYIYFLMGNYSQAISEFESVIKKYPGTNWAARAQYNIGDAFYNVNDYPNAVKAYSKVLERYPGSDYVIDAVNGIQYSQLASGQPDSSSYILEFYVTRYPSARTADRLRYRQAVNKLQMGDYQGAIQALRQYIRTTTYIRNIPDAMFNLADAYIQSYQIDKAEEVWLELLKSYPGSSKAPAVLAELGNLKMERSNYESAITYYQKIIDDYTSLKVEAYRGLGHAYLNTNNILKARSSFQKGLEISPRNDGLILGLAKIDLSIGQVNKAIATLNEISKRNTTQTGAEAQFLIGQIHFDNEEYNEAIKAYSKVKILYEAYQEWVSRALYESAICYRKLGNIVEAQNILKLIIEDYPDTKEAEKAKALLGS